MFTQILGVLLALGTLYIGVVFYFWFASMRPYLAGSEKPFNDLHASFWFWFTRSLIRHGYLPGWLLTLCAVALGLMSMPDNLVMTVASIVVLTLSLCLSHIVQRVETLQPEMTLFVEVPPGFDDLGWFVVIAILNRYGGFTQHLNLWKNGGAILQSRVRLTLEQVMDIFVDFRRIGLV